MKIDAFVLCESVQGFGRGQFSIHNEIRALRVNGLPARSPALAVPIGLCFAGRELGQHVIEVRIVGPDRTEVYDGYRVEMEVLRDGDHPTAHPAIIMDRVVLRLTQPGRHQAQLRVDRRRVATWDFEVVVAI